jgi:uncharacterized membrane protein
MPTNVFMQSSKTHSQDARRRRRRNADFLVINITQATELSAKYHTGEELTTKQRENFRSLYSTMTSWSYNQWIRRQYADIGIITLKQLAR